ncbi:Hint domain-containing protein [uncultured Roseobacter sp.]|uniref:Hint domain-containing protein n=1 Tax=uncultured Roseobacter sp. TaxID=114847 RepID=UPI0026204EB5|nr:Hint domain-containing protein [uncultured Roseobacter sp.]
MSLITTSQSVSVLRAADFLVISGANEGDGLSFADDLIMDDIYGLRSGAELARLALLRAHTHEMVIGTDTELGTPGAEVHLDCALTLMSQDAPVTEVLILVQVGADGHAEDVFALPLAPLVPKTEYQLVGIDRSDAARKLAQVACVSFSRGTHITMGSGRQRPIEELQPGDPVLTRDDGVQPIRWVGHSTQRAVGEFAPIRIAAGTLNNTRNLVVSPDHRLFIYQRTDRLGAGRSELLVKARHLVNGQSVTVQQGGFIDYFQLLFDTHQIIYAEGIAAESMLVDDRTAPLLPPVLGQNGQDGRPQRHHDTLRGLDVQKDLLNHPDAAELLRRASLR